ncbi:uncharacterized protein LOC143208881 [Lasioglossum baleicum]|uniref:uncharacterized protein LOC143208881 n=1 Tax=Lasioglossum baleicum TaxID=434251 RepID=UPI003FCE1E0D
MTSLNKQVIEELKKSNPPAAGVSTSSSSSSTTREDFFDFGETQTEETMDYASEASWQILHFLKEKTDNWTILDKYPAIKAIFVKQNTPLPSSVSVERLFSYATMANSPKRNRLSDENFERRVLLKANLKKR